MTKVINIGVPAHTYMSHTASEIKELFITATYDFIRSGRITKYEGKKVTQAIRVDESIEATIRANAEVYEMSIIDFTSKLFGAVK